MYLRSRPVHNSLLSVMGSWPWYIATTALLGLAMLLALQLLADWIRRRDAGPVPEPEAPARSRPAQWSHL